MFTYSAYKFDQAHGSVFLPLRLGELLSAFKHDEPNLLTEGVKKNIERVQNQA